MKKTAVLILTIVTFLLTGCMTTGMGTGANTGLGGILGGMDANTVGDVIASVLGINKVPQQTLLGTWKYGGPGCAFTSDNALARAGGEVAATKIEALLQEQYKKVGINSSNTLFNFAEDKTFSGKIAGRSISGKYAYDPSSGQISLQTMLFTLNGFVNLNTKGISLLFESDKLLLIFQTIAAISGNTTLGTIGEISKNYEGVRLGFDLTR